MNSIIIIDDHLLFNDTLFLVLKESRAFKVVEQVYDSRQACFKCLLLRPSLVIINYNMQHLNGLDVAKQIKSLNYGCKIVIMSVYVDHKEIKLFKNEGVDGYINKTTPMADLIQALRAILKGEKIFITNSIVKPKLQRNELTKRETAILKLIKKGFTTEQIAITLNLSHYTIETLLLHAKVRVNLF